MTETKQKMSLREEIIARLIRAHIPSPRMETDIILKHAAPEYPKISEKEKQAVISMVSRREKHEPLDKIIGEKEFYKAVFKVTGDVLSPRPDTEILVEEAINILRAKKSGIVLDLGTGSGCILLSILQECQQLQGIGIDISAKAIDIAQINAQRLGIESRCSFINSSWKELEIAKESIDIVVTNPPYIASSEIEELEEEVKSYDPKTALDGGKDGYDCYKEIAEIVPHILKKNGYILIEAGKGQAEKIVELFENKGLRFQRIVKDLGGINRCVIMKK